MGGNRRTTLFFVLVAFQLLVCSRLMSQERCATTEFMALQEKFAPAHESREQFEKWLKQKIDNRGGTPGNFRALDAQAAVITVPVVVHIIHRGESPGTGSNIPDAQILSQIEVLNEDFRRLNADAVNTPALFQPVAADTEIQFALAIRDPEGLPTNGIVRVNGNKPVWPLADNYELKNLSYWPAEDYLNIYVVDIDDNYVGYAQFPVSDLDGLEDASQNPFTDGVIIDYKAFGSVARFPGADLFPQFDLGRTTTHEVGHYFGLRHIWGDATSCSADDFVDDTPPQNSDNGGLGEPCTFPGPNSCNTGPGDLPDMFQNYMDYTNDACLNLFTIQQTVRMRTVLDNSPRRSSLKNSKGLTPPILTANDAGIRRILSPSPFACSEPFAPVTELRNYGTNPITSVEIASYVNGNEINRNVYSITLAPNEIGIVALPLLTLASDGNFMAEITSVNGSSDQNFENNFGSVDFLLSEEADLPDVIDFDVFPDGWLISNPDGLYTWERVTAPNSDPDNVALGLNLYDYENLGEVDLFTSPVIDLSEAANAVLTFDVSYSGFGSSVADDEALMITITDDCESPLFAGDTIYFKRASTLRTTGATNNSYVPSDASDWRTEVVNLVPYLGKKVRLSFNSINAFGNNLFIDNIAVDLGDPYSIIAPDYIFCEEPFPLGIRLTNVFPVAITSLEVEVNIDRQATTYLWTGAIQPEETTEIFAQLASLPPGEHEIEARIVNINNTGLTYGPTVSARRIILVSNNKTEVPFRQNFENYQFEDPDAWVTVSQDLQTAFQLTGTNYGTSIALFNSQNNDIGDVDVLASPEFSLTGKTEAHFNFDLAYHRQNSVGDIFELRMSRDCGISYDEVVFSRSGEDWPDDNINGSGVPSAQEQWERITVDLSPYAGQDNLRLGMFVTNANGGDIFLDNFEFFVTRPVVAENGTIFPNPVDENGRVNITFNVPEQESVEVRLINSLGQVMLVEEFPNILNQTITFDIGRQAPGVYIIQVSGNTFSFAKRVVYGIF